MVAIPDIATRIIGATELPSKSVADDKTDKIYVPIPNIASVLLFIILFYLIKSSMVTPNALAK